MPYNGVNTVIVTASDVALSIQYSGIYLSNGGINVTFTNFTLDLSFLSKMSYCHHPVWYIGGRDLPPIVVVDNSFYPRTDQQALNSSRIFINYYRYWCFPASTPCIELYAACI